MKEQQRHFIKPNWEVGRHGYSSATQVRLSIRVDTNPKDDRSALFERSAGLAEVFQMAKNKFKMKKKPVRVYIVDGQVPIVVTYMIEEGGPSLVDCMVAVWWY